jgi:hypothetical protein
MSSRQVKKLWASRWEGHCRESCLVSKWLGERVARQVFAARAAFYYVERSSDKALGQSLGGSLLGELLGK